MQNNKSLTVTLTPITGGWEWTVTDGFSFLDRGFAKTRASAAADACFIWPTAVLT